MQCNVFTPIALTAWTIGHSTRPWDEFLQLLSAQGISAIADVRRFPGSRRYPWFASERMAETLPAQGMAYQWIPELGGRRKVQPGSPNGAWDVPAFQGYADHMASAEFASGLEKLFALASRHRTALMCAEGPWWRCHRRLIADLLTHRGHTVLHIVSHAAPKPHPLSPMAQGAGQALIYPPAQTELF